MWTLFPWAVLFFFLVVIDMIIFSGWFSEGERARNGRNVCNLDFLLVYEPLMCGNARENVSLEDAWKKECRRAGIYSLLLVGKKMPFKFSTQLKSQWCILEAPSPVWKLGGAVRPSAGSSTPLCELCAQRVPECLWLDIYCLWGWHIYHEIKLWLSRTFTKCCGTSSAADHDRVASPEMFPYSAPRSHWIT